MTDPVPPFVDGSGLGRQSLERLRRTADDALSVRALPGIVALPALAIGFSIALAVDGVPAGVPAGLCVALVAVSALRLVIFRRRRLGDDTDGRQWGNASAAANLAAVATFAVFLAYSIRTVGIVLHSALLLVAGSAVAVGIAHAYAPRRSLMQAAVSVLIAVPVAATLSGEGTSRFGVAALMVAQLAYALTLGRRLGIEYWEGAVAQEHLRARTDELRRSRDQTRELVARNADAIGVLDEAALAFVNPAWARSLGYDAEALVGRPLVDVVHPSDVADLQRILAGTTGSMNPSECRFVRKDGSVVTWELLPLQELEWDARAARLIVARDVTETGCARSSW